MLAQEGRIEGSGSPQSVDAQGIVMTILGGPLAMVDDARGKRLQLEIGHSVGTDHHSTLFAMEGIDYALECLSVAVQVVTIALAGKTSASGILNGQIPAATNAQVGSGRLQVVDTSVMSSQSGNTFGRAVG